MPKKHYFWGMNQGLRQMHAPYFQFKQFAIRHDRCAMKVGTDGVLLGAWADADGATDILDVGTGSGLIALMMAQRFPEARIVGIEIDPDAAAQAAENVAASPWTDRIEIVNADFNDYSPARRFQHIVCNPPYFIGSLLNPDPGRSVARHAGLLSYDSLLTNSVRLLDGRGMVSLIYPTSADDVVGFEALTNIMLPVRRTLVFTKEGKPCSRILLTLYYSDDYDTSAYPHCEDSRLTLLDSTGQRSEQYKLLTEDFYLK